MFASCRRRSRAIYNYSKGYGFHGAVVLALPLGIIAALKRGSLVGVGVWVLAVFGQFMPSFWVAMLLMLVFAVHLQIFPVFREICQISRRICLTGSIMA
jgi:ABC-type dipeptide/oligopeptide/nickel transport system permease component